MKVTYSISIILPALVCAAAVGCVERSSELTAAEREQVHEYVSTEAPAPQHELDISFENKVRLVGYDTDVDEVTPGTPLSITWYWKCERPIEEGWLLFTHIADGDGANRLNTDGESPVRRLYQPGRWKRGEYIKDVQHITLPGDWGSNTATFYVGVWNGPHRLQIVHGPSDGDNRARAASLPVAASPSAAGRRPPQPAFPTARATRRNGDITLDGKLDEAAWRSAVPTPAFVNTMTGARAEPQAKARLLWDDDNLYIGFEVQDDFIKNTMRRRDDHLWDQDCVEVMLDPDGDGRNYFEMQVSPTGVIFDTRYDSKRQPQPFGHVDWNSGLQAAVDVDGSANDDGPDRGYTVEMRVPWSAFAVGTPPANKPTANQSWRMNFFVMDARPEGQRSVAWSPPRVGDFHTLNRFGRVLFQDPSLPAVAPIRAGAPGQAPTPRLAIPPAVIKQLRQRMRGGPGGDVGHAGPARPGPGEKAPTRPRAAPTRRTTMHDSPAGMVVGMRSARPAATPTMQ